MEQSFENIVLYTVIAAVTVPCWMSVLSSLSDDSRYWKKVLFRIGAVVGTLWLIIGLFDVAPIFGAAILLAVTFLGECLILLIIQWLFAISDKQMVKFLSWFFD